MPARRSKLTVSQKADARRLKEIFKAKAKIGQAAFGEAYGIGTQAQVWMFLDGYRPLHVEAARKFAAGLDCEVADFSPTLARRIAELGAETPDDPEFTEFAELFRLIRKDLRPELLGLMRTMRTVQFTGDAAYRDQVQKLIGRTTGITELTGPHRLLPELEHRKGK